MRFVSCYIAGFGKFVNCSFDLSSDLVVIREDNGWGKTTLADFLKSMLYGIEGSRSKSVSANDRMRYMPWGGGVFGGTLVFTYAGRTYRIERTFGKTAGADTVRVYDANNMLSYDFGDRAERLGETLFGVDCDSYRRSVYVPQGGIETGGLPDDMKNRLLSLLGSGGTGETSASRAIEKLDNAERALRAKRKPAKGKLDELDEALEALGRKSVERDRLVSYAQNVSAELKNKEKELETLNARIRESSLAVEQASRQSEFAARREACKTIGERIADAQNRLSSLKSFFGNVDPRGVNVAGLQDAVTEFYALKEELSGIDSRLAELEAQIREKAALEAQLVSCERTLESYDMLLGKNGQTKGAGTRRKRAPKKYTPRKYRGAGIVLFMSMLAAVFGATQTVDNPILGYILLGLGGVGLIFNFFLLMPKYIGEKPKKEKAEKAEKSEGDEWDADLALRYNETEAEYLGLQKKLKNFPVEPEKEKKRLMAEQTQKKERAESLENGIRGFLKNINYSETYACDYRATLVLLKDKLAEYEQASRVLAECNAKNESMSLHDEFSSGLGNEDGKQAQPEAPAVVKAQLSRLERQKEELVSECARLRSRVEELTAQTDKTEIESEIQRLREEKDRLERKLVAIRAARDFLSRAKGSMATKYLASVERACQGYMHMLGGEAEKLRFSTNGLPMYEVNGQMREVDFYSTGLRELTGFCTRIALADAVFTKERPTLILDDPFVNLDDEKTERAKRLTRELSRKYQIIYLTCKTDRSP